MPISTNCARPEVTPHTATSAAGFPFERSGSTVCCSQATPGARRGAACACGRRSSGSARARADAPLGLACRLRRVAALATALTTLRQRNAHLRYFYYFEAVFGHPETAVRTPSALDLAE
ncbi:hypothetical protein C8J57DRAFT_1220151 [Mycena rebaudengoi]|nr:hypothetical protein C8J57DRAFT_1220151 [Mycena rebaudengoi]